MQVFGPQATFRMKVLLPPIAMILGLLITLSVLGDNWQRETGRKLAQAQADVTALNMTAAVPLNVALRATGDKGVQPILNHLVESDPELLFVIISFRDQFHFGARNGQDTNLLREALLDRRQHAAMVQGSLQNLTGMDFVVSRRQLVPALTGGEAGEVITGVAVGQYLHEARTSFSTLVVLLAVALAVYLILAVYVMMTMGRRMDRLMETTQRFEGGDFKARISELVPEELGNVGRAFDTATEKLSSAAGQMGSVAKSVERAANEVGDAKATLQRGLTSEVRDVDDALQSMRDILAALSGFIKQAEITRDDMRQIAGVAQRLSGNVQEHTATVEEAERVVGLTQESIQGATGITNDINRHADTLSDTTSSTASAMLEMKHSIGRVRETAITAASLAEQAGVDAERGSAVLAESMTGMEHIREASRAIGSVTEDLERRVGEIGDVLHLITELTRRTNLLALNASIIAAQAGAEGRGFAVVADEIKDLARRTALSAGSIDTLIQAVAEGAHAARRAAVAGADAVETGTTQAAEATKAMADILGRLRNSAAMSKSIASATEEQTRSSAYVTRSIQEVQGHVAEISTKAIEQQRRTEYLQRQASRLRELVDVLSRTSREHREGMVQTSDTVARSVRSLEDMSTNQRSRLAEGERVRGMLEVLRRVVTGHRDQIATFDRAVADLQVQAIGLRNELTRLS